MSTLTITNNGGANNFINYVGDLDTWSAYGPANTTVFGVGLTGGMALVFEGSGFNTYDGAIASSGVITSIKVYNEASDLLLQTWSGFSINAATLVNWIDAGANPAFRNTIFGGNDNITASDFADLLYGYGGDDEFVLTGAESGDYFDGGAGVDTFHTRGQFQDYRLGTLVSFEKLLFSYALGSETYLSARFDSSQIGAGLSATLEVIGSSFSDSLQIFVNGGDDLDLSGWTFSNWNVNAGDLVEVTLGTGDNTFTGTNLRDYVVGDTGADVVRTLGGDDSIQELADGSVDHFYGGAGSDTYILYEAIDLIHEAAAGGTADYVFVAFNNYTLAANVENGVLNLGTTLTGNSSANMLFGTSSANFLNGAGGNDDLDGGAGDDTLRGGAGADDLLGGIGVDTATYSDSAVAVTVALTAGFVGSGGDAQGDTLNSIENLIGSAFNDTLTGINGANTLDGGAGADTMRGGNGNDIYVVDNTSDVTIETSSASGGVDLVRSSVTRSLGDYIENLTLTGTSAINGTGNGLANVIVGNTAVNVLTGNDGADTLQGGKGGDTLIGGAGVDILSGGAGADAFVLNAALLAGNADDFTDFVVGVDKIHLENAVFTTLGAGALAASAFWIATDAHDADDRIIYDSSSGDLFYDANGNVAGQKVLIATLDPSMFLTEASFLVI